MRYALILTFILGLSAFAFPLQADEVGGGFACPACMGGYSFASPVTAEPLETEDSDTTSTKTEQPLAGNDSSLWEQWFAVLLKTE